jgi:hypothetical protein
MGRRRKRNRLRRGGLGLDGDKGFGGASVGVGVLMRSIRLVL